MVMVLAVGEPKSADFQPVFVCDRNGIFFFNYPPALSYFAVFRIEMAPLDANPYWEYGSGSKTVKIGENIQRFQVEKRASIF